METEGGMKLAGPELERALKLRPLTPGHRAMTLYFLVKYLHVLGAIVILGTGTGIAFFMLMAHRSRDAASSRGPPRPWWSPTCCSR